MATVTKPRVRSAFGDLLQEALEQRNLSIRRLSILWSEKCGGKPESRRRLLHKYIDEGVSPGEVHRDELADLLEIARVGFAQDAQERRSKQAVADALAPLVDVLYTLAREAGRKGSA